MRLLIYMEYLSFKGFKSFEVITSYRDGGVSKGNYSSLNLSFDVKDKKENVIENRRRFFEAIGLDGIKLLEVNPKNCPMLPILYSFDKDIAVGITHSDSLALFFVDYNKKCFGAIQLTREALLAHQLEDSVRLLIKNHDIKAKDLYFYFAPSLMFTNNEVCKLRAMRYIKKGLGDVIKRINEKYYFDEQLLAIKYLRKVNIPMKNISFTELNTFEDENLFFSKKRKTPTGKMMSVIRFSK